ncbi:unnamed protein product [Brassicogethes aeneus]|uniref:Uncharacterized protein n=1 Tax=Brassicogethes aeneus TaxID=1431903 RepID=A0A9P0FNU6_BRAAE|nr:unnamed protein product [Brassicogethes aeneus]
MNRARFLVHLATRKGDEVSNNNYNTWYRKDTLDLMPILVPNETKCVDDDFINGFPSHDVLNEIQKNILKISQFKSLNEITQNHQGKEKTTDDKQSYLVKKWIQSTDFHFSSLKDPGKGSDPSEKEYEELLPLKVIQTPLICNESKFSDLHFSSSKDPGKWSDSSEKEYAELLPLKVIQTPLICNKSKSIIRVNSETLSESSMQSQEINIIQKIEIHSNDVENTQILNEDFISDSESDDSRDKDFEVRDLTDSSSSTTSENTITGDSCKTYQINSQPLSEKIKAKRVLEKKQFRCKFCDEDLLSQNFMRHLERHHGSEKEIEDILKLPKNSKDRRLALSLLRKDTNFHLHISGITRPFRKSNKESLGKLDYYPCIYCKGLFRQPYLKRHTKRCTSKPSSSKQSGGRMDYISNSQTVVACASDPTETLSKLNVKCQVFDKMKGDEISFEVKKDLLIAHFGETYLKKHKKERMAYACSNRMRELARLLISYRKETNDGQVCFKDILHPKNFDNVLKAARNIVGYDPIKKTFKSPSLAMHLGTSLKISCDELTHLILKENRGFKCKSEAHVPIWLRNVKNFKKLIESRWNSELASLANKDLQEKRWTKPLLLPLVNDIKIFRDQCLKNANDCAETFTKQKDDIKTYKLLVNCTLALLILFNRRRIGDVQFLKIEDYKKDQRSNCAPEFEHVLSETELMLTTKYKRVLNSGKGSRAVVILLPKILQNYVNILLKTREKYISSDNEYVFAIPGSSVPWGKGDVAIRSLASKMNLENPHLITSNKLRKHIATIMQILSLSKDEAKQFSQFMGHTEKTHNEFYELPVDIYQTAKVSKLLLMMEKGAIPMEYKGKSLAEINFDINLEYAEENNDDLDDDTDENSNNNNDDLEVKKISENKIPPTITKKGWTPAEVDALKKEFDSYLKKLIYPSGRQIKDYIQKNNINRPITAVKSKLQHLMAKKELNNEEDAVLLESPTCNTYPKVIVNNRKINKTKLSQQKQVVLEFFKSHIKQKRPPKRSECEELRVKYSDLLSNKPWTKIKVFIQNTYKKMD